MPVKSSTKLSRKRRIHEKQTKAKNKKRNLQQKKRREPSKRQTRHTTVLPPHFTLIGAIPATVMRKCTQLYQSSQLRLSQIRGFSILIHFGLSLIWGVPELIHFRQFRSSLIWGHPDSTYSIKSLTITFWTHVGRKHMQTNASRPLKLQ